MENWRQDLKVDPIPALMGCEDDALAHFVRSEMLGEDPGPVERLWETRGGADDPEKAAPGRKLAAGR